MVRMIPFLLTVLLSGVAGAQNEWPQWRGPTGNGVAPNTTPPTTWSSSENIAWKTAIPGRGHSTPIVWGDQIFLTTAIPVGQRLPPKMSGRPGAHDNVAVDSAHQFVVIALSRDDGSIRWSNPVHQVVPHEGGHYTASLASASPVTDGERVYAFFGSHGLYCLDVAGKLLWGKQLGKMHTKHGHGEGSSPAVHGDTLIVNWDHEEQSFLLALDKKNGEEKWRRSRDEVTSWSSPLIVEVEGRPQAVICGTERVRAYNLESGEVIWQCGGLSANIVATPVSEDGIVYVGSSYEKRALMAINMVGARGDLTGTDRVLWLRSRGTPYVPSPLLYDGGLYFLTHYQNVVTRIEARSGVDSPGAMRLGDLGNIYASPVAAGGHVFVTDLQGTTMVIAAGPIPRKVSVNRLDEKVSASLAFAGSRILIRGESHLFCIARPEKAATTR